MMNWRDMCLGDSKLQPEGDQVIVSFEDGRSHRVTILETDTTFEYQAIVSRGSRIHAIEDVEIRLWLRNRLSLLNGFALDRRRRVVAHGWVPKAGLAPEEFRSILRRVAIESDRLEYLLTGADFE